MTASAGDGNRLLTRMPRSGRETLLGLGKRVRLVANEVLGEPRDRIRYVYFPTDGVIALMSEVDGCEALALALIGNEGMVGASAMLGARLLPLRVRVQEAGWALRITATELQHTLSESPGFRRQLQRYLYSVFAQLTQTATCAVSHVVDVRLAYWLLMTHDRARGDRFALTHGVLAQMLGVRRSGVTTAAGSLQARHLIAYTRGQVSILDRAGLELATCDCYHAVRGIRRNPQVAR